jgi:membrane protease YdiL (CAAX protease family)
MSSTLSTQLLIAGLSMLLLGMGGLRTIWTKSRLVLLFLTILLLDNFVIILTNSMDQLRLVPNHIWGGLLLCVWSGKLYSIVLMLGLAYLLRNILPREAIGLSVKQAAGSSWPSLAAITILTAWSLWIGFNAPKGPFDIETLFYLATMPGLNEELTYRGLLLGIGNKLFPGRWKIFGAEIGWGMVVSAVVFGLLHGVWIDAGTGLQVNLLALRNATLSGLVFAWLRERTGSLLMPILAHGAVDVFQFAPRMM